MKLAQILPKLDPIC